MIATFEVLRVRQAWRHQLKELPSQLQLSSVIATWLMRCGETWVAFVDELFDAFFASSRAQRRSTFNVRRKRWKLEKSLKCEAIKSQSRNIALWDKPVFWRGTRFFSCKNANSSNEWFFSRVTDRFCGFSAGSRIFLLIMKDRVSAVFSGIENTSLIMSACIGVVEYILYIEWY